MAKNDYCFLDEWLIPHPISDVWERLYRLLEYSEWWGQCWLRVKLLTEVTGDGLGAKTEVLARGRLPYRLRLILEATKIEPPHKISVSARGDLVGTGTWSLSEAEGATRVHFEWIVRAKKPVIRLLSPVIKPVFEWNHRWVMRTGEAALKRLLSNHSNDLPQAAGRS
jgi:hypothetical protein